MRLTLTFNEIGRLSRLVRTRICSDLSPWLSQCDADELYTVAISHGEGRFVASDEVLGQLRAGGQIATQYVDVAGMPSMDLDVNPNGSVACIEGITSPDGRVFGKMGHVERRGDGLYKNVPGEVHALVRERCGLLRLNASQPLRLLTDAQAPSAITVGGAFAFSPTR
ncbi:MAG: phosphoribosylformylglycinamidine synthase subunit PurQ [Coriobacteriaceae bacterium]